MENFSTSMSAIMTILFGNISASGMIRLIDVAFPKKFIEKVPGVLSSAWRVFVKSSA